MVNDAVSCYSIDAKSITFEHDELRSCDDKAREILAAAAAVIQEGGIVAFPTETVYGLGASALDDDAVASIYAAKKRPADNPLIVHIASKAMLTELIGDEETALPPVVASLIEELWPGPLSILFPLKSTAKRKVSHTATAGLPTFVARMPDHAIARALIAVAGVPIAAPSANTSGRPSPTTAAHVAADMRSAHGRDPSWRQLMILDGGRCSVGVESTVVDAFTAPNRLRILRLGGISPEELTRVTRLPCELPSSATGLPIAPQTPGQKYRHYAPDAQLVLIDVVDDASVPTFRTFTQSMVRPLGLLIREPSRLATVPPHVYIASLGESTDDNARRLFASLRELESRGVKTILVERPTGPAWSTGLGLTVAERLGKAAAASFNNAEAIKVRP